MAKEKKNHRSGHCLRFESESTGGRSGDTIERVSRKVKGVVK